MSDEHVRLISRSVLLLAVSVIASTCTGCIVGSVLLSQLDVPTREVQSDIRELRDVVEHVRERAEFNWTHDKHVEYAAGIDKRLEHIEQLLEQQSPRG